MDRTQGVAEASAQESELNEIIDLTNGEAVAGEAVALEKQQLCFKDYTETQEYKDLLENAIKDYPDITKTNINIAIYGWYSQEVQGIKLPEGRVREPAPVGEVKSMDVYTKEEHAKLFPHLLEETKAPFELIEHTEFPEIQKLKSN